MKLITADGVKEQEALRAMRARSSEIDADVTKTVQGVINDVRTRGDEALKEYTKKFDHVELEKFELTKAEIDEICAKVPKNIIESLERAAENIKRFHERQKQQSWFETRKDGVMMGQRIRGLHRVGIYVPGGRAAYPSSVLMNAIPARVAGVGEIIMVAPPSKDGKINANILAAAKVAGVDRIFAVGGAQAVAALAYGTQSIPKVDKIVGPGNIFVATAKRLCFGAVDIDMIAGPSEILVVADDTAEPKFLAADIMSQAEHDPMACAILLTTSKEVAQKTLEEIDKQKQSLSKCDIIDESLEKFGAIIICKSIEDCIKIANDIAPEHFELMVNEPMKYLGMVDNAGSVFLGKYAPEPLGDYFAGPNHVLPTGGTARFFSPLSVDSFVKKSSFIYYTKDALCEAKDDIVILADCEGLTAHANSIKVRF
jgi:histidinol dehydrogenase